MGLGRLVLLVLVVGNVQGFTPPKEVDLIINGLYVGLSDLIIQQPADPSITCCAGDIQTHVLQNTCCLGREDLCESVLVQIITIDTSTGVFGGLGGRRRLMGGRRTDQEPIYEYYCPKVCSKSGLLQDSQAFKDATTP